MPNLEEFFLNSKSKVAMFDTLQISHPSFSKTYFIVRNSRKGLTATLENSSIAVFEYYPFRMEKTASSGNLDQSFKFTFGELGSLIHNEIDAVREADTFNVKPVVIIRGYRSDDLSGPVYGPLKLEISQIPINKKGFAFEAKPWQPNVNGTGEIYTLSRFPGLRGFL